MVSFVTRMALQSVRWSLPLMRVTSTTVTTDGVTGCCCFVFNVCLFCVFLCVHFVHWCISSGFDGTCLLLSGFKSTAIVDKFFQGYILSWNERRLTLLDLHFCVICNSISVSTFVNSVFCESTQPYGEPI